MTLTVVQIPHDEGMNSLTSIFCLFIGKSYLKVFSTQSAKVFNQALVADLKKEWTHPAGSQVPKPRVRTLKS